MKTISNTKQLLVRFVITSIVPAALLALSIRTSSAGSATWLADPVDNNWNNAANWSFGGPPNGSSDTATFATSNVTSISVVDPLPPFAGIEVNGITFSADATPFTIEIPYNGGFNGGLVISGTGITNNSSATQDFLVSANLFFKNNATAGDADLDMFAGYIEFDDSATAGTAAFTTNPSGDIAFNGNATAANSTFIVNGFTFCGSGAGGVSFSDASSAGNSSFTVNAGAICGTQGGGFIGFFGTSTAGDAVFTINGGANSGDVGGIVVFEGNSEEGPTAGNATLIANGGSGGGSGGSIQFSGISAGGTSRLELFGNATLDVNPYYIPSLTVGSIEGTGTITLDNLVNLTVGSNNLSTTFSGIIQEVVNGPCSLTKIGRGKLTLSSASTYTGGTTVTQGSLLVTNGTGSATGTGAVKVNSGVFGGTGTVSGPITIATPARAATLAPGIGRIPSRLTTTSSLTLNARGLYQVDLSSTRRTADQISANRVRIASGATITVTDSGATVLTSGTAFVIINNIANTPIAGTFSNLPDGSTLTVGNNTYLVSYEGGTGNDLTLTVQ